MNQFFVEPGQIWEKKIFITGKDVNHIKNVLRMKIGEELSISNGCDGKEYRGIIEEFTDDAVVCALAFVKEDGVELPSKVYLYQGLPKADKMELIIQKAVELGVYEIIPVATKRAVVKLDEKKSKSKITRWQAISEAAAKQSKRAIIPNVADVLSFKEALKECQKAKVKVIPYELAEGMDKTKEIISDLKPGQDVAIFIGPEGGFDDAEIEAAIEAGVIPVTLGKRILRTETAGFTILSWIMYQLEN
ncbi:MAG: 16S rRNA (uracil(1498)-N(3))-methyltransferase [Lachnospiraceae bacterium]|nr:16S rRNA (uracil(1498)-N(3))-methyltransferase [Lachnospiraceae bacterium]